MYLNSMDNATYATTITTTTTTTVDNNYHRAQLGLSLFQYYQFLAAMNANNNHHHHHHYNRSSTNSQHEACYFQYLQQQQQNPLFIQIQQRLQHQRLLQEQLRAAGYYSQFRGEEYLSYSFDPSTGCFMPYLSIRQRPIAPPPPPPSKSINLTSFLQPDHHNSFLSPWTWNREDISERPSTSSSSSSNLDCSNKTSSNSKPDYWNFEPGSYFNHEVLDMKPQSAPPKS